MIGSLQIFADEAGGHMGAWGSASMWAWGLGMLFFLVLLIAGLARAAGDRPRSESQQSQEPSSNARDILAERYARGDISTREYRERIGHL